MQSSPSIASTADENSREDFIMMQDALSIVSEENITRNFCEGCELRYYCVTHNYRH